jgi:hypothetical protein
VALRKFGGMIGGMILIVWMLLAARPVLAQQLEEEARRAR